MEKIDLISGRVRLEKLVEEINPDQRDLEVSIYDLLLTTRIEYTDQVEKELVELIKRTKTGDLQDLGSQIETEASFLLWLEKYGHAPAYIVAMNFDPETEHESHRFRGEEDSLFHDKPFSSEELQPHLKELGYKDGAILIKPNGNIYAVRSQLTNVDPKSIYEGDENIDINDSYIYGFREPVNVRHFAALGASFHLKDLITYTLSETSGNIRRYQNGKISFSTLKDEDPNPEHSVE